MADNIIVIIDGRQIEVSPGTLIVEAAKRLGITIPTFCYDDRMRSVGACRMCLVEVEKMPKLVASCATPVAPNMVVHTDTERVVKARKGVLEFLLINHPLDCPTCDKGGECPLQDLTYGYGPAVTRYKENKIRFIEDINQKFDDIPLGPEIILNRNRCIMCFKCIRIVREQAGETDLGVFQRGAFANINILDEVAFADEFSGNTVEYCPVGALTSRSFRYQIRDWLLKHTPSVCNLCPVGCNMTLDWSGDQIYRHMSRRNDSVDEGWLCDRGRYSFDITRSENRITRPHIKKGSTLEPAGWDETIMLVSKHLRKIINENRGAEVAAVGSASLANEEAFAIRMFFNDVVKATEIDFQTDTVQPLEPELIDLIGLDGVIRDLEKDSLFLLIGCDPAVEQPVAALRIKKAIAQRGAKTIFIGSYDKKLGNFPVTNCKIPFGMEPEALEYIISNLSGGNQAPDSKLNHESLAAVVGEIKDHEKIHIISGRGFFNHPWRSRLLNALYSLKKIKNARLSILPTQSNFVGVSHFGLYGEPDHSFNSMLARINAGEIKTLFIFGANPIDEYPDRHYVKETLKKLELLIVIAPFMHATAELASVILPQALQGDYGGTLVNIEGRIQAFKPISEKLHRNIRPAWSILGEISDYLELGTVWYHDSQVRQEMAEKLKGIEGILNLPEEGLLFPFISHESYVPKDTPISEKSATPRAGSYILNWTPSVHHSNWLTEYSANLMRIAGVQAALMHPDDAHKEGFSENQTVRIGNDNTALNLPIRITPHANRGEVLIVNSFKDNPVNRLMDRNNLITYVSVKRV